MTRTLVPQHILDLKPYQAGKPIEELAREKNLTHISKLASNENPFGPSPLALKAIEKSLQDIHLYPDSSSFALKTALAKKFKLKTENIILGAGSDSIMANIARAFIQIGDEVVTCENTFITFFILAKGSGAKIVTSPMKDMRYDVEAMAKLISDKTKIVYIANPDNPSGTYINKKEFDYLMDVIPKHCLVILDEAYFEFAQQHQDYPDSMHYRYDNVITLRTFSKSYGLAGLRIGYGFAHEDLISHLHKVKLPFEPNRLAQVAALAALDDHDHVEQMLKNNKIQYERLITYLKNKNFSPTPSATNFVSFFTGSSEASLELYERLLDQGVIIRPLKGNNMPEYVRVSLGTPQEMDHLFSALDKILPLFDKTYAMQRSSHGKF
ncbi:MAG: histidinol-phosphate transaminase [Bacteriovoracaceae bacterium]|nr:histidinol-phosphate transaminase [Bacteriovoracaceae bacterium]